MARRNPRKDAKSRKGPTPRSRPAPREEPVAPSTVNPTAARQYRRRPRWHRVVGWLSVAVGISIVVVNDLAYGDLTLLPGGHSELYFALGLAVAASGSWWLGLFDRRR